MARVPRQRSGDIPSFFRFGMVPNASRHGATRCLPVATNGPECSLLVIEFDDQGLCFDPHAITVLEETLGRLVGRTPIIIVFVHGWKHNATRGDDNLHEFIRLLAHTAEQEADLRADGQRPVLGVFLSWRGLSRAGNWVWEQSSFWDRQQAAHRVAQGSPREVLGRLRAFRNGPADGKPMPQATLIIIGHSFGGAIVYAAVAQSLIEAASTSAKDVPSFGDLVLLLNPAFSAVSYLPIFSIIGARSFDDEQLPIFVCITAENDLATKWAYPLGNWARLLEEATRGRHESQALIRTMGHLEFLRTHRLAKAAQATADVLPQPARMGLMTKPGQKQRFGSVEVTSETRAKSPFWVASATKEVIDGHNGIDQQPLEDFVRALVAAHQGQTL